MQRLPGRVTQRNLAIYLEAMVGFLMHLADYTAEIGEPGGSAYYSDLAEKLIALFFDKGGILKWNLVLMEGSLKKACYLKAAGDDAGAAVATNAARAYAEAYDRLDEWAGEFSRCFDLHTNRVAPWYDRCGMKRFEEAMVGLAATR